MDIQKRTWLAFALVMFILSLAIDVLAKRYFAILVDQGKWPPATNLLFALLLVSVTVIISTVYYAAKSIRSIKTTRGFGLVTGTLTLAFLANHVIFMVLKEFF